MSLTGLPLFILLALLTVGGVAAAAWYWGRFAAATWRARLGRAGVLAGVQLLLLFTVLAAANDYYGFYSGWGQVFGLAAGSLGGTGGSGVLSHGESASTVVLTGTGGLQMPNGDDVQKVGELQYVTINGQRSGISQPAIVYLPPQYFQKQYAATDFPAAIVSTGYPGNMDKLVSLLHYPTRLATGIALGTDKPMVLIMVSPMVVPPRDTECTDVPDGGPLAETYWADDVPDAIEHSYRVTDQAKGWGLIGDSTGGYCALKIAMMNSDKFSAAVSLSGYFFAPIDPTTGNLYGNNPAFENANDMMWRIKNLPSPPINVLITTSRVGEDDYRPSLEFKGYAKAPMNVQLYVRAVGGHNFETWNSEIPYGLQWLSKELSTGRND